MKDEKNPIYMFSCTDTSILIDVAKGIVDAKRLAKAELAARGLGDNGQWIGFDAAKKFWKLK